MTKSANKEMRRYALEAIEKYFEENGMDSIVNRESLVKYMSTKYKVEEIKSSVAGQYINYFSGTKNVLEKVEGGFRLSLFAKGKMKSGKFTLKNL